MSTQPGKKPKRPVLRAIKIVAAIVATVVIVPLVALPIIAWKVDLGGVVKERLDLMRPDIEEKVGRKIAFGDVHVRLFPTIAVEVKDVLVKAAEGAPPEAQEPLFQLGSARVGIAAWPLLTSFGR